MYVQRLINSDKIDVAMLQETKIGPLQLQIKGYACITSRSDRGTGGCMTLICDSFKIRDIMQSECGRWIACQICVQNEWIGICNVYASNCMQERKEMWNQIKQIDWDVPMIFAGDWNCEEGEMQSNEWNAWVEKFEAMDAAALRGCDALNCTTWSNRHVSNGYIAKRLDKIYL
ncbi:hypothetical protein L7F22_004041 [Adiantum nelumboides]|nr:hypothetical protein [Adiantum nelumboides]